MDSSNSNPVATKKDLKELRQELLGKLATKEEIKKLATKEELSWEIGLLATKIDEQEFNRKKTEDFLFQAIDGIVKTLDEMRTEQAAYLHTFKRYDTRIENHEQRITALEEQKS